MKKLFYLPFVLVLACTACDLDDEITPADCTDCTFEFYEDVIINIGFNATNTVSLVPGNNIVFKYTRPVFNEASQLNETRVVLFEIENDSDSFRFSVSDTSGKPYQGLDTDGPQGPDIMNFARDISKGAFLGTKLNDNEWRVELREVDTSFGIQTASAIFHRK